MPIYATQHSKYKAHLNRVEQHKYTDWPNNIRPHLNTWSSPQSFHGSQWISHAQADPWGPTEWDSNMPHSLWVKSTLYNSDLQFKQERPVNAHFQDRQSVIHKPYMGQACVSLFLPLRDFNTGYYLVQWTLLRFTAVAKASRLATKEIIWRKHLAIPKGKRKQTPLPQQT